MKTVLFLTNAYPYFPGEQFIEDEIGYWAAQTSAKVIVIPMTASGTPRNMPAGIDIDLTLAQSSSFVDKLASVIAAFASRMFWKEAKFIYTFKGLKLRCYAQALWSVSSVLRVEKALKYIYKKHRKLDVAYCYWNEVQAYAAVRLKRSGIVTKVISRAHGFDVYETRRRDNYMPLKRQFIDEMDLILAISHQGKTYLETTYNAPVKKVLVNRLGVPIPEIISLTSESNSLNILSVSFCIQVKRIDKIINAIAEAVQKLKPLKIRWTHIGDGPLLKNLKVLSAEKLTPHQVEWEFLGNKPNFEVKHFFQKNSVDLFINASESEGVPVSIMEAMSYGVPVIAPSVGGISELVSNQYGYLLSEAPTVADITMAIVRMSLKCKKYELRALTKQKIINNYSSERNYEAVVDLIIN